MLNSFWTRAQCCANVFLCVAILLVVPKVAADSDVSTIKRGMIPEGDSRWGLGIGLRLENTPYRGQDPVADLLPILSYEGTRAYLRGTRGGIKVLDRSNLKVDLIAQFRLNRYAGESGSYLARMSRERAFEGGLSVVVPSTAGEFGIELLGDMSNTHRGHELALIYARPFEWGGLRWRPAVSINRVSRDLANYYFGVTDGEALSDRPAYRPGVSTNIRFGMDAVYPLSTNGYLYGSLGFTRFDREISDSPIVNAQYRITGFAGYLYRFGNGHVDIPEAKPTSDGRWSFRAAYGWNAEASLLGIVPGGDFTLSPERTSVLSLEVGRLLDEGFRGWPLDIYVKGAYKRYFDKGLQPDSNGYALYIKGYYYGFPWRDWVKTRFGFGEGLSYADRMPVLERRSIEDKNPNTSKLLNYLDVSFDVSVGDIVRSKRLKDVYLGFVVIHRSGIFGFSDLFGGVDGGSNYNSLYIEALF